jgi:glycosyltransferase involved in cell wall biosynthesis
LLPAFLGAFALAARRASREADVVYAHWLPSAIAALATGKPFAVQLWGTDVAIARRRHMPTRLLLRRARVVVVASDFLAGEAWGLGARSVGVVPVPLQIPTEVAEPDEPPHVLFVGRLSEEKGISEFLEATEGLPRVIVGEGPLAALVPEAAPFVSRRELGRYYERAAVVCAPSRREGYGMVVREAMAHGRPVVATHIGGLADAVTPETGVLVPVGDCPALRSAIQTLLSDRELRDRLGAAARARMADSAREPAGRALASFLA